jgi:hypothetical protein
MFVTSTTALRSIAVGAIVLGCYRRTNSAEATRYLGATSFRSRFDVAVTGRPSRLVCLLSWINVMIIVNYASYHRDQWSRLYGRQFASIKQWKHGGLTSGRGRNFRPEIGYWMLRFYVS